MLGVQSLARRKFLDVGSGSGLFSLAAMKLSAERVLSFDPDPHSVACSRELKRRYFPDGEQLDHRAGERARQSIPRASGSVRGGLFLRRLHQTGDLWQAMANVAAPVAPGGRLFIALNRDQGWMSTSWLAGQGALQPRRGARRRARVFVPLAGFRGRWRRRPRPEPVCAASARASGCRGSTTGSTGWAGCRSRSRPRPLCWRSTGSATSGSRTSA